MNIKRNKRHLCFRITMFCLLWTVGAVWANGQGAAFTYQGRLTNAGNPADGLFDMQFRLFDTPDVGTGTQQGASITNPSVQVTNAVFTVQLDFGAGVFTGAARFLEIRVRPAGSPDPHTILSPRQPLTSIPYAVRSTTAETALNATQLGGQPASGFIQNTNNQQAGTNFNIGGNGTVGGTLTANNAIVNGNAGIGVASPTEKLHVAGNGLFTGNLTASGSINVAGLRTQVNATSPNVIGGNSGNSVTAGVVGATIGGGGQATSSHFNRVTDDFGTIGGGSNNSAGDSTGGTTERTHATVAGGRGNTSSGSGSAVGGGFLNISSGQASTVGGGQSNTASDQFATVGGGFNNTASASVATVGGGGSNTASGDNATVPGGAGNTAAGFVSFAAGRQAKAMHRGAFVWADSTPSDFASTANDQFLIRASGGVGIGTPPVTAAARLTVGGSGDFDDAGAARIDIFNTTAGVSYFQHVLDNGRWQLGTGSSTRILVEANGNVGIGIGTGAVDKLQVAGDIRVGTGTTGCVKDANGTVIAGSCSSDLRFKKQITPFASVIDKLARLQPVHFYWRADEYPKKHFGSTQSYGLIAQEVEAVLPELVGKDEAGYKVVNYSKLPLMLLQAVKELKAENDSLRGGNKELKQALEQQQAQIEALKKLVCKSQHDAEGCR